VSPQRLRDVGDNRQARTAVSSICWIRQLNTDPCCPFTSGYVRNSATSTNIAARQGCDRVAWRLGLLHCRVLAKVDQPSAFMSRAAGEFGAAAVDFRTEIDGFHSPRSI
jgi:hypothetical protein